MLSYLKNVVSSFIFEQKYDDNNFDLLETFSLQNSCDSNVLLESEGLISFISKEFGLIDSKYSFPVCLADTDFIVGKRVWYQYVPHPTGEDGRRIVKVKLIIDEASDDEALLNENEVIAKIVKQEERKLFLSNDIVCDLDRVHVENSYIPEIGDEVLINLLKEGDVLVVHRIKPHQIHSEIGVIVELKENMGFINDYKIWFNRDVLHSGYEPIVGDNVKFTALKNCNEELITWRVFNVCFHSMEDDNTNDVPLIYNHTQQQRTTGLSISGSTDFGEVTLNGSKSLVLKITNANNEEYTLKQIKFRREQLQIKAEEIFLPCVIGPYNVINAKFTCNPIYVGYNSEVVDFCFQHIQISRRFETFVSCPLEYETNVASFARSKQNRAKPLICDSEENRTYGPQISKKRSFKKFGRYSVPPNISQIFASNYEFQKDESSALLNACPVLMKELELCTYTERFHTLLFLEEMATQQALLALSKCHVFFRRHGEYLVLDMPGLAEQRPSLLIGDKVVVTQPWLEKDKTAHVGLIHLLGRDTISVMFHTSFHNTYNQTDCNVRFESSSRSHFLHDAVKRAFLNLREPILFPTALSPKSPKFHIKEKDLNLFNKRLNIGQRSAVVNILSAECRPLPHIVFGPPGTGKTVTIIESVLQITQCFASSRVLVTAPSNSAADLLAGLIIQGGKYQPGQLVRIYAYSRQQDKIPEELLPFAVTGYDDSDRSQEDLCEYPKLGWHRITVGTCSSIAFLHLLSLPQGHFTHIIVDEAGYATEPQMLVPLSFLAPSSGVAVLAGDPKQLGPVVISSLAKNMGLGESYLSRIVERFPYLRDLKSFPNSYGYDPRVISKLTLNYRSVLDILTLPNKLFYNNELEATVSNKVGREAEIIKAFYEENPVKDKPVSILFHGIRGQSMQEADSPSWFNPQELFHVVQYIRLCYNMGLDSSELGVITPYRKQVLEIGKLLTAFELESPKIGSVEEFQGQERQVIIMSCVRSQYQYVENDKKYSLGFISNPKRINVSLTRARSLLIIIGNPHLLSCDPYWRSVIIYCLKLDAYIGCDIPTNFEKIMDEGSNERYDKKIEPHVGVKSNDEKHLAKDVRKIVLKQKPKDDGDNDDFSSSFPKAPLPESNIMADDEW